MIKFLAGLFGLFFLFGCGKVDTTQARQEVLSYDPDFKITLDTKSEFDSKISSARAEFSRQSRDIYNQINKLRLSLQDERKVMNAKVKDFIAQLAPERSRLNSEIAECQAQQKLKTKALCDINAMALDLEKLLQKNASTGVTSADRPKWLERIKGLKAQAQEFKRESQSLEQSIKILRLKLILLKQQ